MISTPAPLSQSETAGGAITVDSLGMTFDLGKQSLTALAGISLEMKHGEFCSFIGPSGCGKSTLLRLIAGLIEPSVGTVRVDGEDAATARQKRKFGFVFQDAVLLPWRTVIENIELPMIVAHVPKQERRQKAKDLLDLVGLADFAQAAPAKLSGGMARRVAIARSLVLDPSILLLDEPFGSLDEITRQRMNVELQRIWAAERCTAVLVTHNVGEAVFLSDRVIVLGARPGRIIAERIIDLPRPRTLEMIGEPRFFEHTRQLSGVLLSGAVVGAESDA
jgi:NitT/TauT family transport system ATP-binding protein